MVKCLECTMETYSPQDFHFEDHIEQKCKNCKRKSIGSNCCPPLEECIDCRKQEHCPQCQKINMKCSKCGQQVDSFCNKDK